MKMRKRKTVIMTIVLLGISIYLTVYTLKVHTIAASHIYETSDRVFWTGGPPGSLFPWPREPGLLEYLPQVEGVDLYIYLYLVKTWLLVGLTFFSWLITGLYFLRHYKDYS
jgi:hypothetical protein